VPRPTIETIVRDDLSFIFRSLERFGVPPGDLEDVAQEVLHGAFRSLPNFIPTRAKLRTWLYKIAFYQAQSFLNRARHHREVLMSIEDFEPIVDSSANGEEQSMANQTRRLVLELIQTIELHRRAVFIAYEIEEMSMLEIAAALSIPVSTGWSRLQQARKQFTDALKRRKLQLGPIGLLAAALDMDSLLNFERAAQPDVPEHVRKRVWSRLQRAIDREQGRGIFARLRPTPGVPILGRAQIAIVAGVVGAAFGVLGVRAYDNLSPLLRMSDSSAVESLLSPLPLQDPPPVPGEPVDLGGAADSTPTGAGGGSGARPHDGSFLAEIQLMRTAKTALDRGDIVGARAILEQHGRDFPGGQYHAGRAELVARLLDLERQRGLKYTPVGPPP
jgi:RNA polymerase sigma-70 factor (ECF subfamily)